MASFPRTKRLTESKSFDAVFKAPAIRLVASQFLLLAQPNSLGGARLGLAISKRHVKLASRRNRVKRVLRASFSLQSTLPSMDVVILSRHGLTAANKEQLWSELQFLWDKLIASSHG